MGAAFAFACAALDAALRLELKNGKENSRRYSRFSRTGRSYGRDRRAFCAGHSVGGRCTRYSAHRDSGGGSPQPVFALLADPKAPYRDAIPWNRLWIFWVDDRCVPPENQDSNFGAARELLLDKVRWRRIMRSASRESLIPRRRLRVMSRRFADTSGWKAPRSQSSMCCSWVWETMGIAQSLFPHTAALHETGRVAVANHVPQQKQSWRSRSPGRSSMPRAMFSS